MSPRLYADNAATSFPKPPEVLAAMADYAQRLGASAGRGSYREAAETGELLARCRQRLATIVHAEAPERIVFTLNCSEAINLALRGSLRPGDHVVTTRFEHNSILRPLHDLASQGIETSYVPVEGQTGAVAVDDLRGAMRPDTRLLAIQHASNVTGVLQPIEAVARLARSHGVRLLVDAAQTLGHVPIDVQALGIDLLAFPGHKGLLGPLGTGGLYVRPGLEADIRPLISGGTGSVSERPEQPDFMPDKYESGSHNAIGLVGLGAAADWILHRGVASLHEHEKNLCDRFRGGTADIEGLRLFGPPRGEPSVAVFSVRVDGVEPAELSTVLETEFDILTRAGLHCAPWAHESLGTFADGGTTRLSLGSLNTPDDVDRCLAALAEVAAPTPARART